MNCGCNKPKRCCGNIPVRTCCPNPTSVTRTEFYDYKNSMKTDMKDLDDRISDKELDLSELELAVSKLELEKQNKLLAGANITLTSNPDNTTTISSTGGGGGGSYTAGDGITIASDEISVNDTIQRKLTAGSNITIDANNVISSTGGGGETYTAGPGITISAANEIATIMQQSDYYNKTEVDNLIANLESVEMKVVTALPATGEGHIIYLVDNGSGYDQYVYSDNQWHNIGSTSIDLTNYYTKAETSTLLDNKQDKLTAGQGITISGNNTISSDAVAYTAGDNITIESGNIISAVDTKYTAGTDIQITPSNVINYIGSGGHMSKAEILNELGLQEIQCIIKDDQGVERTATVVGSFGTTPPTQDIVINYDGINENTMSWRDSYTCQLKSFFANRGEVTPVPLGQADAEVTMTVSGVTLGGTNLGDFTGTMTVQGGILQCQTDSKYHNLYGTVYFTVEASNMDQDEVYLLLHSDSGNEPAQMCRINNLYVEVLDPGHN